MISFVLGGGCFWCLDSSYMQFDGVHDVEVGYMGGHTDNPGYEAVCDGNTGHAEVARVDFDETKIPAEVILDMFFTMHDPRQLNRQGNDIGTQYRSCMFYTTDAQRELFEQAPDEEYHQDFFAKNPNQGYCNAVVLPKMAKVRAGFAQYLKK